MNRTYKTEGIILKRTSLGEADRLVTILTRHHGKLKILAKGVRRITSKRAPSLELFNHSSFFLHHGKTFDTVSDAQTINSFVLLKKHFLFVGSAYMVSELLDRLLAEGQEHEGVYDRALHLLNQLNQNNTEKVVEGLLFDFKIFLLSNLGFLSHATVLSPVTVDQFIEETIERKLKSTRLLY